jgi:hypothetical protein
MDRTSVSEEERGWPDRLITVLGKVSVFGAGVVVGRVRGRKEKEYRRR